MSINDKKCQSRILLGVWGESFINAFLELSLPTLLAPGNIPALANEFAVTFVFLTRLSDREVFEASPAFQRLQQYCAVEFISINDLIVCGNYSTTLTYAFDRAIRATGAAMLDTYFIFLTSDYIMADGSMRGLMRYIKKGYSGICAGNYQVIQEKLEPYLKKRIKESPDGVLDIPPRELVNLTIPHLHSVTIASMLDQENLHNYKANRFFLRADDDLLAGRFYLLHMLCIKPETMEYRVGASCDYSFIPEMCPSGNVGIINDSDDYLVIEVQPREHELSYVHWGPYEKDCLVSALAEWTTESHRSNSQQTIYYHGSELTAAQKNKVEQQLQNSIGSLNEALKTFPVMPYYNHPYWLGANYSFAQIRGLVSQAREYEYVNFISVTRHTIARDFYFKLFGKPPTVYSWHYRWLEYQRFKASVLSKLNLAKNGRLLVLYETYSQEFMAYRDWLAAQYAHSEHYHIDLWAQALTRHEIEHTEKYAACIIFLRVEQLEKIKNAYPHIHQALVSNGAMLMVVPNEERFFTGSGYDLRKEFSGRINAFMSLPLKVTNVQPINCNQTILGTYLVNTISARFSYSRAKRLAVFGLLAFPGVIYMFISNWVSKIFGIQGQCTKLVVTLKQQGELV